MTCAASSGRLLADHDRRTAGAPNNPSACASQPSRAEQRVTGGGEARRVGHRRAGDEGDGGSGRQAEHVEQPAPGHVVQRAATGDITGSAAFWSQAAASHEAPSAAGSVAPITNPK